MNDQDHVGTPLMKRPRTLSLSFWCTVVIAVVLVAAACGGAGDEGVDQPDDAGPSVGRAGQIDRSLTRDDLDCSLDSLGDTAETPILTAHYVVDGALGALCLGDEDPTLIRAFEELSVITPPTQLSDLGIFAGFAWEGGDDATLAFVSPADDDGAAFLMAVGLNSYDDDPAQARLTMAHEFAHVFSGTQLELDRTTDPSACTTHWNGEGCYVDGSIMDEWIMAFWPTDLLAQVDVDQTEVATADGEQRCALDDSFFGPYAATNPEEDFAEAFSAFVYDVRAQTDGQQAKLDWIADRPGLVEFRDRAMAAGLTPLENTFDTCGTG